MRGGTEQYFPLVRAAFKYDETIGPEFRCRHSPPATRRIAPVV